MIAGREFEGEGDRLLRPDRLLVLRRHAERAPAHLYRSRSGQWLIMKADAGKVLRRAAAFLVIAIIAAVFGFGGIATEAAGVAKALFAVFVMLSVASAIMALARSRRGRGLRPWNPRPADGWTVSGSALRNSAPSGDIPIFDSAGGERARAAKPDAPGHPRCARGHQHADRRHRPSG